jgi:aminopeptidase N
LIDTSIVDEYGMSSYDRTAGKETDLPIVTLTTQQSGAPFFLNSYPKPAMGYLYVKDMLGDELFYKGLHNYFRNWSGKHPMPYDFFNSMNAGSGVNLNWFWKRWFFDNGYPDLAIKSFTAKGKAKQIIVISKGGKPVPVDLNIVYTNGTTEKIHRSIAVWEKGSTSVIIKFQNNKEIKKITLGSTYVPDVYREDNVFVVEKLRS